MSVNLLMLRFCRKLRILYYFNIIVTTRINNVKFRIPVFHERGLDHFLPSETWMIDLIKQLLKLKQGVFVDVGVNIGQTLLKLKSVDSRVHYIGFEPNPKCQYYVEEIVRVNSFGNVTLVPSGIFSSDGVAQLFFDKDNDTDSCATVVKNFRDIRDKRSILVSVISEKSLDFLEEDVVIIKIDVEGAELEVIEQFRKIIRNRRPFVICEILPAYTRDNVFRMSRQVAIQAIFNELDYKIAWVGDALTPILEIPTENLPENSNYLFFPSEYGALLGLKEIQQTF